nr:hypothetical protein [Tanacetum cinerariifolium]
MDLFSLISAANPAKVKIGTRPRVAHEVPLLTAIGIRVIDMEETVGASESFRTPSTLEKSPLDFANEDPPQMIAESGGEEGQVHDELAHGNPSAEDVTTAEVVPELSMEKEVVAMGDLMNKRRHKRGKEEIEANAPPKVLRKDHAAFPPAQGTLGGESPVPVGLDTGSTIFMTATHDAPTSIFRESGRRDPDWKCYDHRGPEPVFRGESRVREIVLLSLRGWVARGYLSAGVGRNQQLPPGYLRGMPRHSRPHSTAGMVMGSQLRLRPEQEAESDDLLNQTKNLETLLEAEVDMKKAAEAKNAELDKELGSLRVQLADLQMNNTQLSQQVSDLQTQVTGEEKMKAAFEEFKRYEDDKVEQCCAEMDARLDKLSVFRELLKLWI